MTTLTLPYSDDLQRNLSAYLAALRDLAYRSNQPALVFEAEVAVFLDALAAHFGPQAPQVYLWCKHFAEDLLMNSAHLPEPRPNPSSSPSSFLDQEDLAVLEQTRQYLKRLVGNMAHDLRGRTPDDLRFYLRDLASMVPPDKRKTLLLKVQQTAESYLWLGYDLYQPTKPPQPETTTEEITDGHALANFISWRLLKFRKILWFHIIPHETYVEMADACMAFFASQRPQKAAPLPIHYPTITPP